MNERDRLIELLMQKGFGVEGATIAADHLLANGVIVPPCKVGDVVYVIRECTCHINPEQRGRVTRKCADRMFVGRTRGDRGKTRCLYLRECAFVLGMLDNLGKTVFLTREEAEQALKERKQA